MVEDSRVPVGRRGVLEEESRDEPAFAEPEGGAGEGGGVEQGGAGVGGSRAAEDTGLGGLRRSAGCRASHFLSPRSILWGNFIDCSGKI